MKNLTVHLGRISDEMAQGTKRQGVLAMELVALDATGVPAKVLATLPLACLRTVAALPTWFRFVVGSSFLKWGSKENGGFSFSFKLSRGDSSSACASTDRARTKHQKTI
jgi:hypothetical protein